MLDRPAFSVPKTLGCILRLEQHQHPLAEELCTWVVRLSRVNRIN